MVSITIITALIIAAFISIAVPIIYFLYYKTKHNSDISPLITGIIICLLLQGIATLLIPQSDDTLQGVILTAFAGAIFTSVLEGFGRYFAFKVALKRYLKPQNALMYGTGHGGIYVIVCSVVYNLYPVIYSIAVNVGYFSDESGLQTLEYLKQSSALDIIMSGFEHFIYVSIQIAFAVMIYAAVTNRSKSSLLIKVIVMQATVMFIFDVASYFLPSVMTEMLYAGMAGMVCIYSYKEYEIALKEYEEQRRTESKKKQSSVIKRTYKADKLNRL